MRNIKKRFLLPSMLMVLLSFTIFTTTSCGISSKILKNQVSIGDGTKLLSTKNGSYSVSLQDEVKQALLDTSSFSAFKKKIANEVVYNWYKHYATNETDKIQSFSDKWKSWKETATDSYKTDVDNAKSKYKSNWEWYFQNNTLDPIGAKNKDDYIKSKMMDNARSEFETLLFTKNYFGLPMYNKNASDSSKTSINFGTPTESTVGTGFTYTPYNGGCSFTVNNTTKEIEAHPTDWQVLDYYAGTDITGWGDGLAPMYAYIQHYLFNALTSVQKPVSTSMCLFKTTDIANGWNSVYNSNYVTSADDQKTGFTFPFWEDSQAFNGVNNRFLKLVKDGFDNGGGADTTSSASYFVSQNDTKKAGLIEIPATAATAGGYTDDSATIFKVNLGTDAYTSTFVPYAVSTARLWNAYTNSSLANTAIESYQPTSSTTSNTISSIFPVDGTSTDEIVKKYPLFNNFVFTPASGTAAYTAGQTANPIPSSLTATSASLGDSPSTNTAVNYNQNIVVDSSNKIHADVFAPTYNGVANPFYSYGYANLSSAYRLYDKNGSSNTFGQNLPFIFVREMGTDGHDGSGAHLIGLDGVNYLSASTTNYGSEGTLKSSADTQQRENDILKFRCFQDNKTYNNKSPVSQTIGNFDFTASAIKDYFTKNGDDIILQIANEGADSFYDGFDAATDYTNAIGTDNLFKLDTNDSNSTISTNEWNTYFKIINDINTINAFTATQTNISDSELKVTSYNKDATTNEKLHGVQFIDGIGNFDKTVYKNGLAVSLPAELVNGNSIDLGSYTYWNNYYTGLSLIDSSSLFTNVHFLVKQVFGNSVEQNTALTKNELINDFVASSELTDFTSLFAPYTSKKGKNKYSENLSTNNAFVNSLLLSFSSSNSYSNSFLNNVYYNYANSSLATDQGFANADGYLNTNVAFNSDSPTDFGTLLNEAMIDDYIIPTTANETSLMNNYDPANPYATLSSSTNVYDIHNFKSTMNNVWTTSKNNDSGWYQNVDQNMYGYSTDKITYNKMISTLKYLTTASDGGFDPTNFITYLRSKIQFGTPAQFVWTSQNSTEAVGTPASGTSNFSTRASTWGSVPTGTSGNNYKDSDILQNYQWKDNYDNNLDYRYSTTSPSSLPDPDNGNDSTNVTNSKYFNTSTINVNGNDVTLMGYNGLMSSSSWSSISDVNTSLYNNFIEGNPYGTQYAPAGTSFDADKEYIGSLYQYGSLGQWINCASNDTLPADQANTLIGMIYKNRGSINTIKNISNSIANSVPNFYDFNSKIQNGIQIYDIGNEPSTSTSVNTAQALINAIYGYTGQTISGTTPDTCWGTNQQSNNYSYNSHDGLLSQFFTGINGTYGPMELNNTSNTILSDWNGSAIFRGSDQYSYTRVLFEQINYCDLLNSNNTETLDKATAISIFNNLVTKFGSSLIYQLLIDGSQDNSNQANMKIDLHKFFTNATSDLIVYDRKYNDQLGSYWVTNYKDKN